jgi:hypothetical protein
VPARLTICCTVFVCALSLACQASPKFAATEVAEALESTAGERGPVPSTSLTQLPSASAASAASATERASADGRTTVGMAPPQGLPDLRVVLGVARWQVLPFRDLRASTTPDEAARMFAKGKVAIAGTQSALVTEKPGAVGVQRHEIIFREKKVQTADIVMAPVRDADAMWAYLASFCDVQYPGAKERTQTRAAWHQPGGASLSVELVNPKEPHLVVHWSPAP